MAGSTAAPYPTILDTLKTILVALILAFVFRAFFIEPFIVPTGSMAPTLLGDHVAAVCTRCGADSQSVQPPEFDWAQTVECPNCGASLQVSPTLVKPGDRILVEKWPYDLGLGPNRWDVVVFRDPANPTQNFVKRVAALPHETIEIIDGDVFINGAIARKPAAVQASQWTQLWNQDFQPADELADWREAAVGEDQNLRDAGWAGLHSRALAFNGRHSRVLRLTPRGFVSHEINDEEGSNGADREDERVEPLTGDVRMMGELFLEEAGASVTLRLTRDRQVFVARLIADQAPTLSLNAAGASEQASMATSVTRTGRDPIPTGRPIRFELAHVDGRAYLLAGGDADPLEIENPDFDDISELRLRDVPGEGQLTLTALGGRLTIRRVRLEADTGYTYRPGASVRAFAGNPLSLLEGEYFVLGDNSSHSHDGREWTSFGPHLGADYRAGTIRSEHIVGRAFFVYLPGLLPVADGWLRIPDLGRMRFVQ